MDAKPQRPLRAGRIYDENVIAAATAAQPKSIHQRHKSTPALSNLMQVAATRVGAQKRSAFADVSNQRNYSLAKDDTAINGKDDGGKLKGVAVHVPDVLVKDNALARKPLRSIIGKPNTSLSSQPLTSVVPPGHVSAAPPLQAIAENKISKVQPAPVRTVYPKRSTAVLKEVPEPLIDDILAEQNRLQTEELINGLEQAQSKAAVPHIDHQPPQALSSHPAPAVSTLPYVTSDISSHPAFAPPVSAYPDTHEQAQQALQAVLQREQREYHTANVAVTKSIPLRSQGFYEQDYDAASYEGDYTTHKSLGMVSDTTGGASILLALKHTAKSRAEIAAAKEVVESARTPEEIEDDQWDTSMVAEYGEEIFEYMRTLEDKMRPNPHYMDHQTECQWSMRAVLLDWLVQVHARFTLLPETLFLSVNYIDRFLSCKVVSLAKLQLVGATALFLAAKYEEVNCPSISEIVYMVDNGYTTDEILKAERFMLSMLAFELGWPGPMSFLRRISKADDYDLETRTLAKYFLEVTIMDERFVGCPPSSTAAAAHCLARQMLRKGEWTQAHVYYSNYTYQQLMPLISVMLECCEAPETHHAAVFGKYQDKRYKKASFFVQTEIQNGFQLQPLRVNAFGMVDSSLSNGWRGLV